ncbi:tRNA(Ile)-lysidine synthetase, putative [Babesia ovis]|uniref:tRNA(Ile)-lysidine synthetase, putative n=1 Tax=Babesia ovis TaxID=5869 RepID=A0A9W5WVU4_BABOV|nr:tRNA(Ile)-lysidine synthetase, putative [Babesia ovis]
MAANNGIAPVSAVPPGIALPDSVIKCVLEFVDEFDQSMLQLQHSGVTLDSGRNGTHPEGAHPRSSGLREADLVTRELAKLPGDSPWPTLRRRIEYLETTAATVDKHMAELAQSRHSDLVSASICATQSKAIKAICEREIPRLRRSFDAYASSSLRNGMSIPRAMSQIASLNKVKEMLMQVSQLRKLRDLVRSHASDPLDRICAAAVALHTIDMVISNNAVAVQWKMLHRLKQWFTIRLHTLINNSTAKLGLGFSDSVRLLYTLGVEPGAAASRLLSEYRRNMFAIVLSTLQRYINADASYSDPRLSGRSTSVPSPLGQQTASDIGHWARTLGPNMILLTVCKVLADLTLFLDSVVQDLKQQPVPPPPLDPTAPVSNGAAASPMDKMDDSRFYRYHQRTLYLVSQEFVSLRAYACSLLTALLSDVNIAAAKDRNDYIKLALLLRFFLTVQLECISQPGVSPATEDDSDDSESTRAAEDDVTDNTPTLGVRSVLRINGQLMLNASPKDDFHCGKGESYIYLEALEAVIHTRLLVPYMEHFYRDMVEKLRMCAAGDTGQRIFSPTGTLSESCDFYALDNLFIGRVRANIRTDDGITVCTLNPYNGWTPSSAFLGIHLDNWVPRLRTSETDVQVNPHGHNQTTEQVSPLETACLPAMSKDDWSFLCHEFGCVLTSSSFTFWSHLAAVFRVMALQPQKAYLCVQKLMAAFDWLLLRKIRECQVHAEREFPALTRFMVEQQKHNNDTSPIADDIGTLSILARRVNAVESMSCLLEMLRHKVEFNCRRCSEVVEAHYAQTVKVVNDLRAAVYSRCMLSLLDKRLPAEGILQLLQQDGLNPHQASREILDMVSMFNKHLKTVQDFIENADGGSIPLPVKALLWRYGRHIVMGAMQSVLQYTKRFTITTVVTSAAKNGCELVQQRCNEIYYSYRHGVTAAEARCPPAITHLAAYESLMRDIRNNWD